MARIESHKPLAVWVCSWFCRSSAFFSISLVGKMCRALATLACVVLLEDSLGNERTCWKLRNQVQFWLLWSVEIIRGELSVLKDIPACPEMQHQGEEDKPTRPYRVHAFEPGMSPCPITCATAEDGMILTLQEVQCWVLQKGCPGTSFSKQGIPCVKQQLGVGKWMEGRCGSWLEGKKSRAEDSILCSLL